MARKTYLELVNAAIAESKVTLDPLTSTNFAAPPRTEMYNHFKTWVNRVYKDLLIERNEWFFRRERATVTIYPRLQVRVAAPVLAVGDVLVTDVSNVTFTVLAIHSTEFVEAAPTAESTISVSFSGEGINDLILNETFSRLSPTVYAALGSIKGRGRYSFKEIVTSVDEVDKDSFTIQSSIDPLNPADPKDLRSAPHLKYFRFNEYSGFYAADLFTATAGTPYAVVSTEDGLFDFYPRPDSAFDVSFSYSQEPILMSAWDDVPSLLPAKFEDRIMWGAIAEYADFDERPKVYSRAKKNIDRFTYLMGRDSLPPTVVDVYRFDY